ncbi:MAG: alanine:cation symporter family protein [Clostridiales bacterium]|nr:alanine:cation symporter family protein [Clostridiales bacterium]
MQNFTVYSQSSLVGYNNHKINELAISLSMFEAILAPVLLLFGAFFTIKLEFYKPHTIINLVVGCLKPQRKLKKGEISPISGLLTALAGTIGTGNIVGVVGALIIGGAGAIFWMWVSAFFSLATKYSEVFLAVKYKKHSQDVYGPMVYIEKGLGKSYKPLAILFCVLGIIACLGVGNSVQANAISESVLALIQSQAFVSQKGETVIRFAVGIFLAFAVVYALHGGAARITKLSSILVPIMSGLYMLVCILVFIKSKQNAFSIINYIVRDAFDFKSVVGGFAGVGIAKSINMGITRGVFSHEAGMGSGSIAHAAASATTPQNQATLGIIEVVVDTFVICSATAISVISAGVLMPEGGNINVMQTIQNAFATILGNAGAGIFLSVSIALFAFSSMVSWSFYGSVCLKYVTNSSKRALSAFNWVYALFTIIGTVLSLNFVWSISAILNLLMAVPNLYALARLRNEIKNNDDSQRVSQSVLARGRGTH